MDKSSFETPGLEILGLTTDIVSAYVAHNALDSNDLPKVIKLVHSALNELVDASAGFVAGRPDPAVPIKKSIHDDYLICLEDGKKLKMLKRHLKTAYDMSPEQYRERWSLGADYPMVAPNYAKQRSFLAIKIGLGRKRASETKAA